MAHLFQRTPGGNYYIEWRDEFGKHHKKSTGTANKIGAERLLKEHEKGALPTHRQAHLPLDTHIKDFIDSLKSTAKPQQWKLAKERIERIVTAVGCTKIDQITPARIIKEVSQFRRRSQQYVQKREKAADLQPDTDRPLSVKSKLYYLQAMRQFTKWLTTERRFPQDVLGSINLRRISKQWTSDDDIGERTRNRYSDEEILALLAFVEADDQTVLRISSVDRYRVYKIAANTGLRRLELSRLTAEWFDLEAGMMNVPAGKSKAKRADPVVLPVDFTSWLGTWLPSLPARQELFPRLRAVNTAEMLRTDLERAGLPTMREGKSLDFHTIRHTFCSRLWDSGLQLPEAMKQSRHATAEMIIRYSHVNHDQIRSKLGEGL